MSMKMTPAKLNQLSMALLRRLAYEYNLTVLRDYTKQDIADMLIERLGEDATAWTLCAGVVATLR